MLHMSVNLLARECCLSARIACDDPAWTKGAEGSCSGLYPILVQASKCFFKTRGLDFPNIAEIYLAIDSWV